MIVLNPYSTLLTTASHLSILLRCTDVISQYSNHRYLMVAYKTQNMEWNGVESGLTYMTSLSIAVLFAPNYYLLSCWPCNTKSIRCLTGLSPTFCVSLASQDYMHLVSDPSWQLEWTTLVYTAKQPTPTVMNTCTHKTVKQIMYGFIRESIQVQTKGQITLLYSNTSTNLGFWNKFHAHPLNQPNLSTVSEWSTCNLYPMQYWKCFSLLTSSYSCMQARHTYMSPYMFIGNGCLLISCSRFV